MYTKLAGPTEEGSSTEHMAGFRARKIDSVWLRVTLFSPYPTPPWHEWALLEVTSLLIKPSTSVFL